MNMRADWPSPGNVADGDTRVSFVMPFTCQESIGTRGRMWRRNQNGYSTKRLTMMLSTFRRFYNQDDVARFMIICPDADISDTAAILRSVTTDDRYVVVSERDICPGLPQGGPGGRAADGWAIQQILKLAAAEHVASRHYVTLDADIVCLRPCGVHDLVSDGKAIAGVETADVYRRLYTDSFAAEEARIKQRRYEAAAALLGYERDRECRGRYFSETPCSLHTSSVIELIRYLASASQSPWPETLTQMKGWTEYALYFQFLESRGLLDVLHTRRGCNAVLDLETSVCQVSEHYRERRTYDRQHFMECNRSSECGPFVAIQSWLPIEGWLPAWASTLDEFYDQVSSWLLPSRVASSASAPVAG
jgi:hypothetical protein